MKSPAFQLYVNDFLGSAKVGMMSTEEIGAYMLLLFLDWQEGGFVYEPKRLAKWCRLSPTAFRRAWEQLGQCFVERDGRMWNPRLAIEREKQLAWKEKAAKGAAKTNAKRWEKGRSSDEIAKDDASLNGRIPFPSPSPIQETASFTPDERLVLDNLPPGARAAWEAEIRMAREGMHGKPLTAEQIDRACREYAGNGHLKWPTLRHFRGFLSSAGKPASVRAIHPSARPSKQEAGRIDLQTWLNEKEAATAAGVPDGE